MKDFLEFIREQGIVGLAVGFILGGAAREVVSSLVEDIIDPVLGLILGRAENLADYSLTIADATISWGHFITVLIDFVIMALVVYILIKQMKLDQLDKKKS